MPIGHDAWVGPLSVSDQTSEHPRRCTRALNLGTHGLRPRFSPNRIRQTVGLWKPHTSQAWLKGYDGRPMPTTVADAFSAAGLVRQAADSMP